MIALALERSELRVLKYALNELRIPDTTSAETNELRSQEALDGR